MSVNGRLRTSLHIAIDPASMVRVNHHDPLPLVLDVTQNAVVADTISPKITPRQRTTQYSLIIQIPPLVQARIARCGWQPCGPIFPNPCQPRG